MPTSLPLPTLLSQTLVALTIELDMELELRMPHFTATGPQARKWGQGPWLVSWAMWANFLRYVGPDGTPRDELQRRARITDADMNIALEGMTRWGYVGSGIYVKGGQWKKAPKDAVVAVTPAGVAATNHFRAIEPDVETRWRERYGKRAVDSLANALAPLVDDTLPAYLPIAHYSNGGKAAVGDGGSPWSAGDRVDTLVSRLARVLLSFTLDYEKDSGVSLGMAANFLPPLDGEGTPVRDLRIVSGVSKEAWSVALKAFDRLGLAKVDAAKVKVARLTPEGADALTAHHERVRAVEAAWRRRAKPDVAALRAALEPLVGGGTLAGSPLAAAVEPRPGTWRAALEQPDTLPHHPLVLHRGGYPDGS